jgi:hypothetical protein
MALPIELATAHAVDVYRRNVLLFQYFASTAQVLSRFRQQPCLFVAEGATSRRNLRPDFKVPFQRLPTGS